MNRKEKRRSKLKVLPTGDEMSAFVDGSLSPQQILRMYGRPRYLLSSSAKTAKSLGEGILSKVLYLTPGIFCPFATQVCRELCLGHTSGRMQLNAPARDRRAALLLTDEQRFMDILFEDLCDLVDEAAALHLVPAMRLNGTSDISWERLSGDIFKEFPEIEFYDYTKIPNRMSDFLSGCFDGKPWPDNYHLIFSMGEAVSNDHAISLLEAGGNVAVVFCQTLPKTWNGFQVIDGDKHDARFLDEPSTVVGLLAKGRPAKTDDRGFVVRIGEHQKHLNAA